MYIVLQRSRFSSRYPTVTVHTVPTYVPPVAEALGLHGLHGLHSAEKAALQASTADKISPTKTPPKQSSSI